MSAPAPRFRHVLAAFVLVAATVLLTPGPSGAAKCTCKPASVAGHAREADAVFTGQVTGSTVSVVGVGKQTRRVRRFAAVVDRVYQGNVSRADVVIVTSASTAACGLGAIPVGRPWVFFADGSEARFFGDACGGSGRATGPYLAKVERALGPGTPVVEPTPERPPLTYTAAENDDPLPLRRLVAPGAAVSLLGLLGLAAVRRGRRSP